MNQKTDQIKTTNPMWLQYLIGYLLFFVLCAGIAFIIFRIRTVFIQFAFLAGNNSVIVKGISNLGVMIFAIFALIGVLILEDYLRKGIQNGTFRKKFLKSLGIELAALLLTYLADLVYHFLLP